MGQMTLPAGQSHNSPCLLAPCPCVWKKSQGAWGVGISLGGQLIFSGRADFQAGGRVKINLTLVPGLSLFPFSFLTCSSGGSVPHQTIHW